MILIYTNGNVKYVLVHCMQKLSLKDALKMSFVVLLC